jgi:hypothetical protein
MGNRIISAGLIKQLKEQIKIDDELYNELTGSIESVLIEAEIEDTRELAEHILLRLTGDE